MIIVTCAARNRLSIAHQNGFAVLFSRLLTIRPIGLSSRHFTAKNDDELRSVLKTHFVLGLF